MKYLSEYIEAEQTKLFDKLGVIFAFSEKQFTEQKVDGKSYTNLGSGCLIVSGNEDQFMSEMEKIVDKGIKQDTEENGIKKIIWRELGNYETQITNDLTDVFEALESYNVTNEEIRKEYSAYFQHCIDNDYF